MTLKALLSDLQTVLEYQGVPDASLNGLQVEGRAEVKVLATAVDASLETVEKAAQLGAHALLVHHGIFWKQVFPIAGRWQRFLKALLDHDISLIAMHLPLDIHPQYGNNALLAKGLGMAQCEFFGSYHGVRVALGGILPQPTSLSALQQNLGNLVGGPVTFLKGGPDPVQKIAVVSGGGGSTFEDAVAWGAEAFVTGEAGHILYHGALENRVSVFMAGHYATETFGVRAVGDLMATRHGLTHHFIDVPTGL